FFIVCNSCLFYVLRPCLFFFLFFTDTSVPYIYTLSLHDALPILPRLAGAGHALGEVLLDERQLGDLVERLPELLAHDHERRLELDRKSTRLNSSHVKISYAVFCLIKKTETIRIVVISV